MRRSSSSKESPTTGAVKITTTTTTNTTGSPALRRSGRNGVTSVKGNVTRPSLRRKSDRLNKNTTEEFSSSRQKSDRFGTLLSSCDESVKDSSIVDAKRRKAGVETTSFENEQAKRRLDARVYRNMFVEQLKKRAAPALVPIEEPELLGKLCQNASRGIDSQEAKDSHQRINNQSANKLPKRSKDSIKDSDLSNNIAAEVQLEGVITMGGDELSEQNVDSEVPASKCEASPARFDSLKRMSSEESACVSSASHKESPPECDGEIHASVPEDIPFVSSHDNKGSASDVGSDRVEADSESRVNLVQADAISRDSSLRVDVNVEDDEENVHIRDADDLDHCDAVMDSARALDSDSAFVSRSGNEADNLSGKSASSPRKHRFAEYWVPARLSNLQLEQYCCALLSNSISLCSSSRSDPVGALRNLLVTLRQTCSHPFLVDRNLSSSLLKDVKETEYLDVGIKASGKLQLLDSMLFEMRKRGLRVLILYESIDGRDGIGDILDDFLRQRYGQDSYERVDGGGFIPSKKQAALNKFNDKESGRFTFLLETHACLASIKLSSVDAIIIHNSEWNPVNDIRALQRIVIDSQHDPIKVFRLFLPQTVEENAMLLAKHNVTIDNSMHCISQSNRDKLLMNGASDLFNELERFHCVTAPVSTLISSLESSLLQDVVEELMTILLQNGRQMVDGLSVCLKVQRSDGDHVKHCLVSDELKTPLEEKWPRNFWSKLLEGRNPRWKYVSSSNQRNRKRVRYDESNDSQSNKSGDVVKRRRKVVHDNTDVTCAVDNERAVASDKDFGCDEYLSESLHFSSKSVAAEDDCSPLEVHSNNAVKSGNILKKSKKVSDTQKGLFKLKPELRKLCEVLNMPDDVKSIAERFLEYVMENQHVGREPVTMLQAFHLSVCWVAASLRKLNINCQESLALAKQHLKFCCNEDDADYVYLKMGLFKELFIHCIVNDKANDLANDKASKVLDPEKLMVKIFKQIKKKCRQRLEILTQKQLKELEQLKKSIDAEMAQLEQWYKLETAVVRSIHACNSSVTAQKIGVIEDLFSVRLEEHRNSKNTRLKNLEDKHLSERDKECALTSGWMEDIVKEQLEILRKLPLSDSENSERKCISNDQLMVRDGYKNGCRLENQEILKSRPDVLAGRDDVGQSGVLDGPPTLPAAAPAPAAISNSIGVDSDVSTSAKSAMEHSTRVLAGECQLPCGQVSNSVNLTPDIEVPESSSVDACSITSQQLSPLTDLISGSGLLSTPTIDGSQSHSRDNAVSNQHESKAPSTNPIVPLTLSTSAPDNEVRNSSPNGSPLLQADDSLPPTQIDVEVPATEEGQAELSSSIVMLNKEQSATDKDVGPLAAELLHQLPHSSSSLPNSSRPLLQVQPSQGIDSIQNTDDQNLVRDDNIEHPNPSQLPTAVSVSFILPTSVATPPASLPGLRHTQATSNFANSLVSNVTNVSTVSSRVPILYMDPLQGELERIQKEADHSIMKYEDLKRHLNSECEKEIEELVAQIRTKYETKLLELDAAFTSKKKELDTYHKKVYMNKMLAEAFRNKCMELKVSAPRAMSQDNMQRQMPRPQLVSAQPMAPGASSAVQNLGNLQPTHSSMHPRGSTGLSQSSAASTSRNLQATYNPLRPSGHIGTATQTPQRPGNPSGPSRFAAVQTSVNPQTTHNHMRVGVRIGTSAVAPLPRHTAPSSAGLPSPRQYHTPPLRNSVGTSPTYEAVISLPAQTVNSSSAFFSSNSSRPVSATSAPPAVNLRSVSGVRAPPPHLRARVSQPLAPNTTFSASPPITSFQHLYSNVSLGAPLTTGTNGPLPALQMTSELENQLLDDVAVNQTNRGSMPSTQATSASATSELVCLSDDD